MHALIAHVLQTHDIARPVRRRRDARHGDPVAAFEPEQPADRFGPAALDGDQGLFLLGVVCKTVLRVHAVVAVILGLLTIAWMSLSPLINEGSPFYRFHSPLHTYLTIVFGTTVIFLTGFLLTALNRRGAE